MDRLRPRQRERPVFSGFTNAEIEKMGKLLMESRELLPTKQFCKKIARSFSSSSARAGKPIVKWTQVQNWFLARQQESSSKVDTVTDASRNESKMPADSSSDILKDVVSDAGQNVDLSKFNFEAKSSKDGAWYDVDAFLAHRVSSYGDAEVRVRFAGFGAEEDEWVRIKDGVREQSIPFDHSECHKVKVGDVILCLQERRDQEIYYDARVLEIERKMHDIRGCRCLFLIQYDHDSSEERVRLRRLCYIPGQQDR